MVRAVDLVQQFWFALYEYWGYIWGKHGVLWTQTMQDHATNPMAKEYGQQWVGHIVADCSGLGFDAFEKLGGYIFHGSDTIWHKYVCHRCELKNGKRIDGKQMFPGDPVFLKRTERGAVKRHHIGYYVGEYDGAPMIIEAQGTINGVCTNIRNLFPGRKNDGKGKPLTKWHETAHWVNVLYENGVIYMAYPVLRRGSSGEYVELLQNLLNQNGYSLEVDGKFGAKTTDAVKDYQLKHGLVADGIVGDATWSSLVPDPEPGPSPAPGESVLVSLDDLATMKKHANEIVKKIDQLMVQRIENI